MAKDDLLAVNTAKKQRGKPFEKGKSGNPKGRPKGSRNKTTLATLDLLNDDAEEITKVAIEKAKEGDMTAIKLVMDRICPPRKDIPVNFELDHVTTPSDLVDAIDQLLQSVSKGDISPSDAQIISNLIEQQRKTLIGNTKFYTLDDI